ncbi:helix-turn-helix transcriptional regulator [Marinobacter litoralis]|nr:helix-turn-helix transcriptional regulator [Marinobacter litoralis]
MRTLKSRRNRDKLSFMTRLPHHQHTHSLADRADVGARLREHRKRQGLTLKQLSEQCGVALSTLSKMELGQATVSYDKLAAAARALKIDLSRLFSPEDHHFCPEQPTVVTNRIDELTGYGTGSYEYHMMAGDFPGRSMTPLYARIIARELSEFDDFVRHPGQEFTMVLSGRIRIQFENGEHISLGERETAYFNSEIGHVYLTEGDSEAEVIAVMSDRRMAEEKPAT